MSPQHFLLIIGMNFAWALTMVLMKVVFEEVPPLLFMAMRCGLAALVLLPMMRWHPEKLLLLFAVAMTAGGVQFAIFFVALNMAEDVSSLSVASQMSTPFATLLSILLLGERIGWRRSLGIGLAFGGIVYISFDPRVFSYLPALLMGTFSSLIAAVSLLLLRILKGVGVFDLQGWIAWSSWPLLLGLSLVFEGAPGANLANADWSIWSILVFTVLISNVGAHAGLYFMLQRYPVTLVSPLLLLTPVFVIVMGIVILGDQVSWRMGLGMLVSLIGVAIVTLRQPPPRELVKEL